MEEPNITPETAKKGKGKPALIIILILLLAASLGGNYWFWNQGSQSAALAETRYDSLQTYHTLKDSLLSELEAEQMKVDSLRAEIFLYQNDNDSLMEIIAAKESKIASLKSLIASGGSTGKLRALKDSIARMREENMSFRTQMDSLLRNNEDYQARLLDRENQISALEAQKKLLSDKVNIASMPSVGPVIVTPMYEKKGIYIPIYKARKVERLQITFDVLGNKLTEKTVRKEYIVRVIDPDGIVLSNTNTKLSSSDDVYTVKEDVSFNGTQQKIKVNFTQSPSYKKGKYRVELKENGETLQQFSFELM